MKLFAARVSSGFTQHPTKTVWPLADGHLMRIFLAQVEDVEL